MDQITTYSISKLQKALELSAQNKDYFFINIGKEPLYTDEPFRTATFSVVLLKKGEIRVNTGLVTHNLKAPAVISVGPTIIRSFSRTEEKPEMELIFFTESFLLEGLTDVFLLSKFQFFEDNELHSLSLSSDELSSLAVIFGQISTCLKSALPLERAIIRHLIFILVYGIDQLHYIRAKTSITRTSNSPLLQRFRSLVTKEFLRHRSVNYYADELHVTPKYLSEVCKRDSGMTAGEWIDKAVLLEAKVLLQNRSMNIAQISDYLNFSDQSLFGKYFKNLHGCSPLEYRRTLE
ncbi:helix-turn-helix domain-containing protein [Pedobacter sp.]|uniref:AraC family transcriptional regulator n=1 Tax=Pedobacter sp. TaxID=1411316 RepID=UPI003C5414D5